MKKNIRISVIDLLRILFMGFIMMLHFQFQFSDTPSSVRGRSAFIFVEAFFMITGYFTTLHFSKIGNRKIESISKESIRYTIKKFKPFLPYVIFTVILGFFATFLFRNYSIKSLFIELCKIPMEIFFGSSFLVDSHAGPLWYISALFIVFPIFCMIVQIKKYRYTRNLLSFIICLLFLFIDFSKTYALPSLMRAFFCLIIGLLIYEVSNYIAKKKITKTTTILLQFIETSLLFFIFFVVLQHGDIIRAFLYIRFDVLLSFIVVFSLIFSRKTYSSKINSSFISKLSEQVLPIYLIHENIAIIMRGLKLNLPFFVLAIIYYAATIAISVLFSLIVKKLSKKSS